MKSCIKPLVLFLLISIFQFHQHQHRVIIFIEAVGQLFQFFFVPTMAQKVGRADRCKSWLLADRTLIYFLYFITMITGFDSSFNSDAISFNLSLNSSFLYASTSS
jgi:hypothetical protein